MANFDEKIDRRGTHSEKWDLMEPFYGVSPKDGLPMWVADMEFRPPKAVDDALQAIVDSSLYGYYGDDTSYRAAICGWLSRRHGWEIEPEWLVTTPGLVVAIGLALQAFTEKGDGIVLFSPVYHSFASKIESCERRVVESELVLEYGQYSMDLLALEMALTGDEKMLILCSPHNPGGRVWSEEEIREVAEFCARHDLILVSDEIHHDLVYAPNKHTVTALASPESTNRLITLLASSKTFNIAGGKTGTAVIADPTLRATYIKAHKASAGSPNRFGMSMAEAAYNEGDKWLEELLPYLAENRRIFSEGMRAIPGIRPMEMQATYLAWVDFSGTGMNMDEVKKRVQSDAQIAASHGETFGKGGDNFLRFNIACPRAMVEDAVDRLQKAFSDLQ